MGLYRPEKQVLEVMGPGPPSGLELIFMSGQADIILARGTCGRKVNERPASSFWLRQELKEF